MAQRKNKEMKMKFVTVYLPSKKKKEKEKILQLDFRKPGSCEFIFFKNPF